MLGNLAYIRKVWRLKSLHRTRLVNHWREYLQVIKCYGDAWNSISVCTESDKELSEVSRQNTFNLRHSLPWKLLSDTEWVYSLDGLERRWPLVVKFNKNDDQWDNYPHTYKQSPDYTCFIKYQFPSHSSHCFYSSGTFPVVFMIFVWYVGLNYWTLHCTVSAKFFRFFCPPPVALCT